MQNIKEYCKQKKIELANYIEDHKLNINMVVVQVGSNPASDRYVRNKMKDCEEVGIHTELNHYEDTIDPDEFYMVLRRLNESNITGYIVQLPLPKQLDENIVKSIISPSKDIDGFHPLSRTEPCTPLGIITYLEDQNYDFTDKNCIVIGRSNIVGRPMARMLLDRSANVTVLHSKTSSCAKSFFVSEADLVICAAGSRLVLTNNDFYNNSYEDYNRDAFIFDVGINFTEDGKMVGDCENVTVCGKTPVPGGCGLTTRLGVILNLIKLAEA